MTPIRAYSTQPSTVLRISGEDHADFLQSQGTADLRGPSGICRYNLWLDHKGLIHGDSFVLKISGDEMMLVSHETPATALMEKFSRHIIADDVEMEDESNQWEILSIAEGSVAGFLESRGCNGISDRFHRSPDGFVYAGRIMGSGSLDYLVPSGFEIPHDIDQVSFEEAESVRIRAGILSIPRDVGPGSFNPLQANLMSPLSFDKGCYLGQEVVARLHRLGRLSSRFVSISGHGEEPPVPFAITDSGKIVGGITSVAKNDDNYIAIGWLKSRYEDGWISLDGLNIEVLTLPAS